MQIVRAIIEAPAVSFRYPHFLVGRQLTFDMPPPSTIYGFVASAMGRLPDPEELEFAYWFRSGRRASDLETQHILTRKAGKRSIRYEITLQPHHRDFLHDVRLELYLHSERIAELESALRNPVFCTCLGRSQDLASILEVKIINLVESDEGYIESTILPFSSMRTRTGRGVTVHMPQYIGPPPLRRPTRFQRYIVLLEHERIFVGKRQEFEPLGDVSRLFPIMNGVQEKWWIDPESRALRGARRAVVFHRFSKS